jgi:hypothetical protein
MVGFPSVGFRSIGKNPSPQSVGLWMTQIAWEITQGGNISNLKRCKRCNEWFFARDSHYESDKTECKNEFHRVNPDDKKCRADWAKEKRKHMKRR